MVHIILENLLSTSSNRLLYETLWALSLSKNNCKIANLDSFSITQICNDLIQDINKDDPDRSKFYFSTQLAFGAVQLYRFQINKLFNQVKIILQTCNSTFFEINWLSKISDPINSEEPCQLKPQSVKKEVKKSHKGKQQKEPPKQPQPDQLDLLERFFSIPEIETQKKKNKNEVQERDPTMINNTREITLIEKIQPRRISVSQPLGDFDEDEFGGKNCLDFFSIPTLPKPQIEITNDDHQVPEIEFPPKVSLMEDVAEIVNNQKSSRKRRSSTSPDISARLAAKEPRLTSNFDESYVNNLNNSSFDQNLNAIEVVAQPIIEDDVEMTPAAEKTPETTLEPEPIPESMTEPEPEPIPESKPLKPKHKKQKLIFDKTIVLKAEVLVKNNETYVQKFTEVSPLGSFTKNQFYLKYSDHVFWKAPAMRLLKVCATKLLPLFSRNLKPIPRSLLKRVRSVDDEEEPPESPKKPRKLRDRKEVEIVEEIEEVQEVPQVLQNLPAPELDLLEDFNLPRAQTEFTTPPQLEDDSDMLPVYKTPRKSFTKTSSDYVASEKWSKQMIMDRLSEIWHQNDHHEVTMAKISSKTNRFIAAGIFFELMVLSKEQAVELTQGAGLGIADIKPGQKAKIYI